MDKSKVIIRNKYSTATNVRRYIIKYSSRDEATQAIYPTYGLDGLANLDQNQYSYKDGLAFSSNSISLNRKDLLVKSREMQDWIDANKDNKAMLMVMSFDTNMLVENKILRKHPLDRGDIFENLDELRLRYAIKESLNDYKGLLPKESDWIACVQCDTRNVHAHIVLTGNPTGIINKEGRQVIRDRLESTFEATKEYRPRYNRRRSFLLEKENLQEYERTVATKDAISLQRYLSGLINLDTYIQDIQWNHNLPFNSSNILKEQILMNLKHHQKIDKKNRVNKLLDIPRRLSEKTREHLNRAYDLWRADNAYDKQMQNGLEGKGKLPSEASKPVQDFYQTELLYEVKCAEKYRQFYPYEPNQDSVADVLKQRNKVLATAELNDDLIANEVEFPAISKFRKKHRLKPNEAEKLKKDSEFKDSMLDNQRLKNNLSDATKLELLKYQRMIKKRAKRNFLNRIFSSTDVEDSLKVLDESGFLKYPTNGSKAAIDMDIDAAEIGRQPKDLNRWQKLNLKRVELFDKAKKYLDDTFQHDPLIERCQEKINQVRGILEQKFNFRFEKHKNQPEASINNSTISLENAKMISEEHRILLEKNSGLEFGD